MTSVQFPGFAEETFLILDRLKAQPNSSQYKKEKASISSQIMTPFKLFRDDLVVNWVIPEAFDLITERNVFSRFLKNDFGKGGCNHHLWFSFYRPGFRRLTDLQLAYSIFPEGFNIGLYVAERAEIPMNRVRLLLDTETEQSLSAINRVLAHKNFHLVANKRGEKLTISNPLDSIGKEICEADELWLKTTISRSEVITRGAELFSLSLDHSRFLQPLYRWWQG